MTRAEAEVPAGAAPAQGRSAIAHRFVDVGACHLYADLGPIAAWRTLWDQQSEFLSSEGKTVVRARERVVPPVVARGLRASRAIWRYVRRRRSDGDHVLGLPVAGALAIVRRSGAVKVLDAPRNRVVTVMTGADKAAKLAAHHAQAVAVAGHDFAPAVLDASLDEGWFAEEFVGGRHPSMVDGCTTGFDASYLPLLVAFVRAESPERVRFEGYVRGMGKEILAPGGLLPRLPTEDRERVGGFVRGLLERMLATAEAAGDVPLVLSHGDFFSGNVVIGSNGAARAIDWAHLGRRSPLHDLYYVVMNHCVKVFGPEERRERMVGAIERFAARLAREDEARHRAIESALSPADAWRWLFYLECVHVPMTRCDDPNDRYVRAMLQRIDWFEGYEAALPSVRS